MDLSEPIAADRQEKLISFLCETLPVRPISVRGDWWFGEHLRHLGPMREAAVLILLRHGAFGTEVLLTRRSAQLSLHPGDIALPGGSVDPEDMDRVDTALRETWEEIGVPAEAVDVLGQLDEYEGVTGWRVAPVVGVLNRPVKLDPSPHEVEGIFWISLRFLTQCFGMKSFFRSGRARHSHRFALSPSQEVWGMTAGMLVNLLQAAEMLPDVETALMAA